MWSGLVYISNNINSIKKTITIALDFFPNSCNNRVSNPSTLGDKLPEYRVQREYTNWEEISIEAESQQEALDLAESDEELWEYARDVNTYNYTGDMWAGEADE